MDLKEKKNHLELVSKKLKRKFYGIDDVIDRIINSIKTWYLIPECLQRPTIVNLWGLTGVGKTDLIRSLVNELKMGNYFVEVQMDIKTNRMFNSSISGVLLNSSIEEDMPGILLLDEFQRYRTIDDGGSEKTPECFNDVWALLSDGSFPTSIGNAKNIEEYVLNEMFNKERNKDRDDTSSPDEDEYENKNKNAKFKMSVWSASSIKETLNLNEPIREIMQWTPERVWEIANKRAKDPNINRGKKYDKLLIFISGNLDEVYSGICSDTGNADVDADVFHKETKKLNVTNVKNVLRSRFKPEQIARLGNNHVIYPSLSRFAYEKIIKKEINQLVRKFERHSKIKFKLTKSVFDTIYRNGVYPAQGTRPIFTTIGFVLGSSIPEILLKLIENGETSGELSMSDSLLTCVAGSGKKYSTKISCDIDNIIESRDENELALVSVHEAGHAVLYSILSGECPSEIMASLASRQGGYMRPRGEDEISSKSALERIVMTYFGGRIAEQIVFGDESVSSGASSDYFQASTIIGQYIRRFGMGDNNHVTLNSDDGCLLPQDIDETSCQIVTNINAMYKKADNILRNNTDFLLEVSNFLFENGKMEVDQFYNIAKKYLAGIVKQHNMLYNQEKYKNKLQNFQK